MIGKTKAEIIEREDGFRYVVQASFPMDVSSTGFDDSESMVKIMEAAPEMLEALEEVRSVLICCFSFIKSTGFMDIREAIKKIDDVIAKAKSKDEIVK